MTTYLWSVPNNYPEKIYAYYDRGKSPDRFLFLNGEKLTSKPDPLIFNIHSKLKDFSFYDHLENMALP